MHYKLLGDNDDDDDYDYDDNDDLSNHQYGDHQFIGRGWKQSTHCTALQLLLHSVDDKFLCVLVSKRPCRLCTSLSQTTGLMCCGLTVLGKNQTRTGIALSFWPGSTMTGRTISLSNAVHDPALVSWLHG